MLNEVVDDAVTAKSLALNRNEYDAPCPPFAHNHPNDFFVVH